MIVYHGTTMMIQEPQIIKSEIGRDFGFAFYTTDIKEQAERWAVRKARMLGIRSKGAVAPIVNVYRWDETKTGMVIQQFHDASLEWLEMVVSCRSGAMTSHSFDVVIGRIADDNVGETISYVVQGIMRKEDAIERLKFERINNQIAFCTEKSLTTLSFQRSYVVGS